MDEREFKRRTKDVALRVIRLVDALPGRRLAAQVLGRQVLRSGTAIGANYRAACRAMSRADMAAKLSRVEEEADETLYWMELIVDAGIVPERRLRSLMVEVDAILSMVVASLKTLRGRGVKSKI
jgi:four helix bundle protein